MMTVKSMRILLSFFTSRFKHPLLSNRPPGTIFRPTSYPTIISILIYETKAKKNYYN
uniref:Uncharacterized protein n=1 Tax=Amphimedon queenslandica TaxID=400682 RepID=A0A1X7V4T9_AMPQE